MIITAKNKASNRTKNRLREHGPEFVLVEEAQSCLFDNGARLWVLVKNDTWIGWLPEEEINII
jgi:hypothetical protein